MLVNSRQIAEMAKVKKATVSTWKRRYLDFPSPVTHKLYDHDEIEAWLEGRRKR